MPCNVTVTISVLEIFSPISHGLSFNSSILERITNICYRKIFLTISSCTEGLFPFSCADLSSLFDESRAKNIHFSTYTLPNCYARCVYTCCSTTACVYRDLCQKIQNEVRFPCHDKRSMIFGLPYTGNVLTRPFSYILEAIREQF